MTFRDRLLATLRAVDPVLAVEGVLVIGSEVPNLLQPAAASTLVVSQDVDVGVPVSRHEEVKDALRRVEGLHPSSEEPSVWVPELPGLLEVNFVGMDPATVDAADTYVLEDDGLPLLVFGQLSLLRPGVVVEVEGARAPLPRPAGLILEKLLTDRSGEKGERDLLVVLGLLLGACDDDLEELEREYRRLPPEHRHAVRSNLTILSLLRPHRDMPDPERHRERVARLLLRLEAGDPDVGA
jgi:hypothetical protein